MNEEQTFRKGYGIVVVLTACAIIGFVAGLAGSYLLSQPAFRHAQSAKFKELDDSIKAIQEKIAELEKNTKSREELEKLGGVVEDLTSKTAVSRSSVAQLKKNIENLDRLVAIRMTKIENRAAQLEETAKQVEQQLTALAKTMTACDNDQKEQLRQLKLRLTELENKIAQMPRTP